jgi:DNA excision repair protein ERCC-2
MDYSLDARTARLSVGEFSDFTLGPRDSSGGQQGLWRAQLGTYWHQQLRAQATTEHATAAEFEIPVEGRIFHRGWTITLNGRIDQLLRLPPAKCHVIRDTFPALSSPTVPSECHVLRDTQPGSLAQPPASIPAATRSAPLATLILREIKTVTRPLPADEAELRRDYPSYFTQLATYVALARLGALGAEPLTLSSQLIFVETGSGLAQTLALTPADENLFRAKLERIVEFLDLRLRARERLRHLSYRPAFATPRPGQETTAAELTAAFEKNPAILFEAPTGFGKTGVLLEFALGQLRSGHFDRALYLTSKATGQLQVVRTLSAMTDSGLSALSSQLSTTATPVAVTVWHVRNKAEHCVNHIYHCHRESCTYLADLETRWASSGLARFYLLDHQARDLPTLRAAGKAARICPYEITRAALAFNDVWIGDYNYVFAPANRTLFYNQPGFDPARTLLVIDEAHNLPTRVADAHSHHINAADARALLTELDHLNAPKPLLRAWETWALLLSALPAADSLDPALEADVADTLSSVTDALATTPLDASALGPHFSSLLWQTPQLSEWIINPLLKKLLWSPRPAELSFTCLDAADTLGETLRAYGGVVLASATLSPTPEFTEAIGLAPPTTEISAVSAPTLVVAHTPWRADAYDLAYDLRVDTSFRERTKHHATTAATIAALHAAASAPSPLTPHPSLAGSSASSCVAVFFPSYAYAEIIAREIDRDYPGLRVALQPRLTDLAAQTAWVEESLVLTDALFLVLGSSFAESIDLLGGRITHAMVVGPALPEVNAVQRARLSTLNSRLSISREAAFRRVYQIPGMAKVNQALGRLVRAPGQRARVLLHCRRFAELSYAQLLAPDYQFGQNLLDDTDLAAWLDRNTATE